MPTEQPKPIAYIYDRHATNTTAALDLRLKACEDYAAAQGWELAGCWIDTGDHALLDGRRPAFDALLRAMRADDSERTRVLLVYDWPRLSRDEAAKRSMARRALFLGGAWVETSFGETLTTEGRQQQVGRLTNRPVIA